MKRILIVEDSELNLDLLIQLLEDDYVLISAADGQRGVEMTSQSRPDLVLMDMSLPILDGWTAASIIKSNPDLAAIPIIGLSSHAMAGDRERALAAGCDEYLTKPLDETALFALLARFLGPVGA